MIYPEYQKVQVGDVVLIGSTDPKDEAPIVRYRVTAIDPEFPYVVAKPADADAVARYGNLPKTLYCGRWFKVDMEARSQPAVPGRCEICGKQLPRGEEMFRYHGFSGPCPQD